MNARWPYKSFIFFILPLVLLGCEKLKSEKPISLDQSGQKIVNTLKNELKINASIQRINKTVWIYVPIEEDFFYFSADDEPAGQTDTAKENPSLKYIKTEFIDREFNIRYDIALDRIYAKNPGYAVKNTPSYQITSQKILTAISQSYFTALDAPDFFVIVVTDIRNGIEIRNTFYLDDLKGYMSMERIPQEEFTKRSLYDIEGNPKWIGDKKGKHLAYTEITMPEFLAKQITNRVTFSYQKSSFTPSSDTQSELLTIAANTLGYYDFKNFDNVRLRNLADNTEVVADPAILQTYKER